MGGSTAAEVAALAEPLAAKLDPGLDVVTALQGAADLETLMPMLYSEGVLAGRISLPRFVELTSANAARLFGGRPGQPEPGGVPEAGGEARPRE